MAILGSTGSIGRTALRVLDRHRERFQVIALTANRNEALLAEQVATWTPAYVSLVGGSATAPAWCTGGRSLEDAATLPEVDIVLNAVVGAAGLDATLAALGAGKRVALANKESLVVAGDLVVAAAARGGGEIVPVDSEHSAILQCLAGRERREVRRVILTASGGPFRDWSADELARATLDDALRHPTWSMGRKITVDSATLVNKALEVIEAHYLFGLAYECIEVVVHPQSIVHSFVEFVDGSVLAQLGVPNMELPVLYALTHPERIGDDAVQRFDPVAAGSLTFEPVRHDAFPALRLGIDAGRRGGAAPAVFNAANEQAVQRFLAGEASLRDIPRFIEAALAEHADALGGSRDELLAADAAARRLVSEMLPC